MTWKAEAPPVYPSATLSGRIGGVLRLAALAAVTVSLFLLYLLVRGVERLTGGTLHRSVRGLWGRLSLRACGLRLVVRGTCMPHGGAIVANHSSWIDIFTLMAAAPVNFVSKSEVRGWPGIGTVAAYTGTMFIERRQSAARRQTAEMRARIVSGQLLCFFPEGTSTDGLRVLPFKSSLFAVFLEPELHETVWVQPVSVIYQPVAGAPEMLYGWWGDMDFGRHMWDIVCLSRGGQVQVVFHPPHRAADFSDRKRLARVCGEEVAEGMARARAGLSPVAPAPAPVSATP
ncbi:1-acyl-sn-glycerol-3-phosphate acyltransferase [Paroceanicella profunda]|uniref:1-acyl-sn-glycerol-3-phosphate acyltransferase n=1 Tax=Paroceanicella profunda TaxID=2579971 RepID=A0A5B8FUD0_9RHOB|nr:lysophospholipid acyltransferase family protein [Paroceanicella profunda]QDL90690.1 1-acyl-sn-glycerol-3-phosphate acyltransferase [Paroceanicella profunda]